MMADDEVVDAPAPEPPARREKVSIDEMLDAVNYYVLDIDVMQDILGKGGMRCVSLSGTELKRRRALAAAVKTLELVKIHEAEFVAAIRERRRRK